MKKKVIMFLTRIIPVVLLVTGTFSCSETFDVMPETALDREQTYQNKFDADAAVVGVYGKLMHLAEQYVVLNELRADLVNVTGNASSNADLLELNYHNVSENNKYADPGPFYEVIINCNDVLQNLDKMLEENKLNYDEYAQRYSDVGSIRSWVYLQLGIHFGAVPYVTDPLVNVNDLRDNSKFEILPLEQLLVELIEFTEALPYKDVYQDNSSLLVNVDGFNTEKFFINKELLMGDLNLWSGNYREAAMHYKAVLETGTRYGEGEAFYEMYRNGWGRRFNYESGFTGVQSREWRYEWIWDLPFSNNFSPGNPFIDLFASVGGKYLLKPSEAAIDKWESETRTNGTPVDPRGFFSWREGLSGKPVVYKYLYNYNPALPFDKSGNWFLARSSLVHLRFAEAANRDNRERLAYALLNNGIKPAFDKEGGSNKDRDDVTNVQNTFDAPPYDFDAREGNYPWFRGPWYRNIGIRGRAGVTPLDLTFASDSTIAIENAIIHEAALELAFEGHRWQDLLRIALRRDEPAFLADRVYEKLKKAEDPRAEEVRSRLMNRENWFLPFRWE